MIWQDGRIEAGYWMNGLKMSEVQIQMNSELFQTKLQHNQMNEFLASEHATQRRA